MKRLEKCNICPRKCNADRTAGKTGVCGVSGEDMYISRAALHMWEEPCISGEEGSGTVFFAGCNLKCVYCQNKEISRGAGTTNSKQVSVEEFADICIKLQKKGANNINLVTPTHYAKQISTGIRLAKSKGLSIPVVYNTSGYENVETLKMLEGIVDIYLTDFKYMSEESAGFYSKAPDYPSVAKLALDEMTRQIGNASFEEGIMKKGVIVRYLLLPGYVNEGKQIVSYLYKTYGDGIYISLMNQYTPVNMEEYPMINRRVTEKEYDELVDYAIEIGVENGFIQEGETAKESFIPDFSPEKFLLD